MRTIFAACVSLLTTASVANAATTLPVPGTYRLNAYVVSETLTGKGSCSTYPQSGDTFFGQVLYPGAGQKGALAYIPQLGSSTYYAEKIAFTPATPTGTTTTWSGGATISFSQSAGFGALQIPITFNIKFRYFDANAFEADLTFVLPNAGGGTCTQALKGVFLPTS